MHVDRSQTVEKVVEHMKRLVALRGAPESITSDNGSEFAGQAMDVWAHQMGVKLDFIRPGRPAQNPYASLHLFGTLRYDRCGGTPKRQLCTLRFLRHGRANRLIQ